MSTQERTASVFSQDADLPPSSPGADGMIEKALEVQKEWSNLIMSWRMAPKKEEEAANVVQKMMLFFEQHAMMMHVMGRLAEREVNQEKYYSTVVKTAPRRAESRDRSKPIPKHQYAVLINPKQEQSSEITKKAIQTKVFSSKTEVRIKSVKKIKKGGIAINTTSEEDIDKLIEEFKNNDEIVNNCDIIKPQPKKPKLLFMVSIMT
ncbi:hypothetical protein AVEN_21404-1 [Araneus ventricosus]|uniref:Uncharacterized protein n=1 Tax=Araneus ventricosus TaxID=182803 RepID=A0A4Y2NU72_ARAVE|nr:hypothetical protein AVEN_21404-1 [Araneus ventricosus]